MVIVVLFSKVLDSDFRQDKRICVLINMFSLTAAVAVNYVQTKIKYFS